jgi:DNA-binding CsgD family transcriptional regulator
MEFMAATSKWELIGRDAELRTLAEAMDDVEVGGAVLYGAPGVGKTRLAHHALEMAWARSLATVSVKANRSASTIPFVALAPLFAYLGLSMELNAGLLPATTQAIHERRGDGRLVLVVDDAQELDDASGALLDHLLQSDDVFIVLTARMGEREVAAIHDMWKDERIIRIQVAPLTDPEVRALAAIALGGPVDSSSLQLLAETCAGNVLFLRELIKGALESGTLEKHKGMWRFTGPIARSARLHDLIEQRLSDVTDDEREALGLVALGEPLELTLLSTVVSAESVESLERRGVLESEQGDLGPEIRFNHPLFGEVVRTHLSPVRRARLSRALADAAESATVPTTCGVLRAAVWRLDGGGEVQPDTTLAAAREAFGREDYELSGRLARMAWDATQSFESVLLLTDSYDRTGRSLEIEEVLVVAYPMATDDAQRAELAIRRSSALFGLAADTSRADQVLAHAADQTVDQTSRRRLECQQATHFLLKGEVTRAIDLLGDVPTEGVDLAFAQASRDLGVALALAGRTGRAVEHTSDALASLDLEDQTHLIPAAGFVVARALALCEAGVLGEADALASAANVVANERRNADAQGWTASALGLIRCTEGQLATAAYYFREAATRFESLGHPGQRWSLGGLALAAGQMGDADGSAAAVTELEAGAPTAVTMMDVSVMRGCAWALVAAGNLSGARDQLLRAVSLAESWGQFAGAAAALHDLLRLGESPVVARQLQEMTSLVDGEMMSARAALARAVIDDDATRAEEATERFVSIGALLFAAESAGLERRLATAAGLSRRAVAAGRKSASLAQQCESPRTPGLVGTQPDAAPMSRREEEIATLAARGQSTRQIAELLCLSTRTVDNHLQRAYYKLGVSSRQELRERLADNVEIS